MKKRGIDDVEKTKLSASEKRKLLWARAKREEEDIRGQTENDKDIAEKEGVSSSDAVGTSVWNSVELSGGDDRRDKVGTFVLLIAVYAQCFAR